MRVCLKAKSYKLEAILRLFEIARAVLQRFKDVTDFDVFRFFKISDGAREFNDAMVGTG